MQEEEEASEAGVRGAPAPPKRGTAAAHCSQGLEAMRSSWLANWHPTPWLAPGGHAPWALLLTA